MKGVFNELKVKKQNQIENGESSSDSSSDSSDEIDEDKVYQTKKNKELGGTSSKKVSYEFVVICECIKKN